MVRGTKVDNYKNMSISDKITIVEPPMFIYIPLVTYNNRNCKLVVSVGDYVYKGQVVAHSNDKYNFPIHSSVSGYVKEIKKQLFIDNTLIDAIVIENDFREKEKEKIGAKKKINTYTQEEVVNILKDCGIVGMSGTIFPTYYKYGMELKIKKLVINAVEGEPYITSDFTVLNKNTPEILEAIDALMEIFNIEECVIAVKSYNQKAVDDLIEYIGSYTKIRIECVKDIFPIGWEKHLIKYLFNENIKSNPIEKSIIVNNISTIYNIYKALKYRKPVLDRVITISGDAIKKPRNVIVKEGMLLKDILNENDYKVKKPVVVINGPMTGNAIQSDEVIITRQVTGIVILKEIKEEKHECINCGKCTNICPSRLSPILIKNNINKKDTLKKLNPIKCIECGLCSYICPSKIDLREDVKESKKVIGD